jgi:hypothetical protein
LTEKKKKKRYDAEHSTAANPPPKAHAQKAKRRRVCGSATVRCNERKIPFFGLTYGNELEEK